MTKRIVLADDHQMFREALCLLLGRNPDYEIVGETGDGLAVFELVQTTRPDIVCMDIDLPGLNGVEATRHICSAFPAVRVIALSSYTDAGYVKDMLAAGARAYVTKTEAGGELLHAIEAVARDRSYLCPDATEAMRDAATTPEVRSPHPEARLGRRELQVLKLVALGNTSASIADQLDIAVATVDVHRRNIMRKLNLDSAIALTRYAIHHQLVPSE